MQGEDKVRRLSRRSFLALGLVGAGAAALPGEALGRNAVVWGQQQFNWSRPRAIAVRALSLYHRNTGETVRTVYYENGRYIAGALREIDFILRDFRTDEVRPIDTDLLDLLYALQQRLETGHPYEVYSAYRSPTTNAMLRREGVGVARNSMHMYGKAIDVTVPGVSNGHVARAAWAMQRGGVGTYRRGTFVHLDTGEVRSWRG